MSHKMSFARNFLYYFVGFMLLLNVVILTAIQLRKFLRRDTTFAYKTETEKFLPFPTISFCPGYKNNSMAKFVNMSGEAEADHNELWNLDTFELREVLRKVELVGLREDLDPLDKVSVAHGQNESECLGIRLLETFSGRCYSIVQKCPEKIAWGMEVAFLLRGLYQSKVNLFIHHYAEDALFGLNENYWLFPSAMVEVKHGQRVDLELEKKVRITRKGGDSYMDYYSCVGRFLTTNLENIFEKQESAKLCDTPAVRSVVSVLDAPDLKPCSNISEALRSAKLVEYVLAQSVDPPDECRYPREEVAYKVSSKEVTPSMIITHSIRSREVTHVFLSFESFDVSVSEEYVLLDFWGFLSAVGGIIGMFLGWSVMHVVEFVRSGNVEQITM